jgi:hypothetical protein
MKKLLTTLLIIFTSFSCVDFNNDVEESKPMVEESIPMVEESKPIVEENDGTKTIQPLNNNINKGNFGLYCPNKMKVDETYDVFGLFSLNDSLKLTEDIKNIISNHTRQDIELSQNTNYTSEEIMFYDKIELILIDPTDNFKIKPIHSKNIQSIINGKVSEKWHWKVTPINLDKETQLMLYLKIYKNDIVDKTLSKTYFINIKSGNYFEKLINYIFENPTWLLTTIIIPLIVFLYKNFKKNKED